MTAGQVDPIEALVARGFNVSEAQAAAALVRGPWYYRIQLTPELWTQPVYRFDSIALTRELLSRTNLSGVSLLDIGTMEGVTPTLATARGARRVVAYDRWDVCKAKVALVQRCYGREFSHITGLSFSDFRRSHDEQFDVVVFSGVFYHMIDPLGGLMHAASFCKPGGIFIFESSAVSREDCALHFNKQARYYPGTTYFQATPEALDCFFRLIGLAPLDCVYHIQTPFPSPVIRVAVACRVGASPLPHPGDTWMVDPQLQIDFDEFYLGRLKERRTVQSIVDYGAPDRTPACSQVDGILSVESAIRMYPAWPTRPEVTELSLNDAARH